MNAVNLNHRRRQSELMDQPGLDASLHRQALRALARVNRLSGTTRILWQEIARVAPSAEQNSLRILDIACGGGDVAIGLAKRACRARTPVEIEACDVSPTAVEHGAAVVGREGLSDVRFVVRDALLDPMPDDFDVVICTLFLHHLDEQAAIELLVRMGKAARRLVLIDDLCRSRLGYGLAWVGCRVLSRSPIVRVDGPLSVEAAFTASELASLAKAAGLNEASVRRHFPERMLLTWKRP